MAKYQQYEEYKDSGVEDLGCIPIQWKTSKLAYTFLKANAGEVIDKTYWGSGKEVLYTCNKTPLLSDYMCFPEEKRTTKNDLLLTRNGTPYVHKPIEGSIYSNVVQRITLSSEFDRNYLTYCLGNSALSLKGYGVSIESFNFETWKSMQFATPSMKEQKQIVNFLDHETAQIDILIEKQQTLIQLLKEKRQAVISHAVTKGLNTDAVMKGSGVEWVEFIPKHWKAHKLGYCANVGNGATPSRENFSFWKDGSISWLNSSKINDVVICEADQFITPLAKLKTSVQPVQENDILIAITGEGQTRGRVAICKLDATINQHLASIRIINKELDYEYLYYWLNSNYSRIRFESTGTGSTKGAITCGDIASYPVLIPPKNEQQEIVKYLKEKNNVFDRLINSAEKGIQLMQERRTALISAAVTGKIDVRGWQASESR